MCGGVLILGPSADELVTVAREAVYHFAQCGIPSWKEAQRQRMKDPLILCANRIDLTHAVHSSVTLSRCQPTNAM